MKRSLLTFAVGFLLVACQSNRTQASLGLFRIGAGDDLQLQALGPPAPSKPGQALLVRGAGKRLLPETANPAELIATLPTLTPELRAGLERQRALLKRQSPTRAYHLGGKTLHRRDFMRVIDDLLSGRYMQEPLRVISVAEDSRVRFTGYYSPEVRVSRERTETHRYPILRYPKDYKGRLPTRHQIEQEGALNVGKLAIAWAEHPLDVYTLQLQGSGFVSFPDGERRYLAYGGTNRYPYQSIERLLLEQGVKLTDISMRGMRSWISEDLTVRDSVTTLNPNYGFFVESDGEPRGAAGVPLTPMASVAADPRHYPLGSVLLASVPVADQRGSVSGYETRVLLVQDTGGAINGDAHLDLYTGVGEDALTKAQTVYQHGRVFVLSPR